MCVCVCVCVCVTQRALSRVSDDEWLGIPDVGDARNKRERNPHVRPDRYNKRHLKTHTCTHTHTHCTHIHIHSRHTPVPDTVLQRAINQTGRHITLASAQQVTLTPSHPHTYHHPHTLTGRGVHHPIPGNPHSNRGNHNSRVHDLHTHRPQSDWGGQKLYAQYKARSGENKQKLTKKIVHPANKATLSVYRCVLFSDTASVKRAVFPRLCHFVCVESAIRSIF